MSKHYHVLFQRAFNIYPGETRNALLFACLGFLWAFGVTCGLKFADALFLIHVGADSLPELYTWTSCGMLLIASVLLYAFNRYSSSKIFHITLATGISFYLMILLYLFLNSGAEGEWFWYTLRIAGSFLFAVLMTCYWTFVDQYHHIQDAKRLFTLYSSTLFLGATSTGIVMQSGMLSLEMVIMLVIALLLMTTFSIRRITSIVPAISHEDTEPEGQGTEQASSLRYMIQSILTSRFTLLLMASNLLMQLLSVITEFNYMSTFQNYFASESIEGTGGGTEAQLTVFLGQWLAIVSCANLFFGLFVYSRVIRRFGVTSMLLTTPTLLMISFTGWSLSEALLFPLIGFFVVEGTLYVIDDSNFNLLLNAVPTKLKYKIRVVIESFFEPVGMLTSAILLHLFQNQSKMIGLVLAACMLVIGLGLRSQYLKALFSNLTENAIHFQRTIETWLSFMSEKQQHSAEHRLLAILKLGDDSASLFACEGLLAFENRDILEKLLNYASQMPSNMKLKLLNLLEQSPFAKEDIVLDTLYRWAYENIELRGPVHFYLAKQGLLHPEKALFLLSSPDKLLQGAAIMALKDSFAELPPPIAARNRSIAEVHLKMLLDSPDEDDVCMGLRLLGIEGNSNDIDTLLTYLDNPSLIVARTAAQAIAQADEIDPIRHSMALLTHLKEATDNEIRLSCLKALGKTRDSTLVAGIIESSIHFRPNERRLIESIVVQMGLKTVPTLIAIIKDSQLHDRCRMLAGGALGRLSLPQLRANLQDIIQHEIDRAYFYYIHSHSLTQRYPQLDLNLLSETLYTGYQSALDFIIQLLGAAGEVEDVELLSRSIRSRNPKVRSQVVETLEKTCEHTIFRLLRPLLEDIPYEEKLNAYLKSGHTLLSLTELLDKMSESPAQMDRIMAATLKYQLNLPNWRESLRQQMLQQDEIFHHFAYELLDA